MPGYAPSIPLRASTEGDTHKYIEDIADLVYQNVRTLLLTTPGERIWDPQFGVGIRSFLFEPAIDREITSELPGAISKQFQKYMSFLELDSVATPPDDNNPHTMMLKIKYFIRPLSIFQETQLRYNMIEKSVSYSSVRTMSGDNTRTPRSND